MNIDGGAGGTVFVTDFAGNAVSGGTGGSGVRILGAVFDSDPTDADFDLVAAGSLTIGAAGSPVGASGLELGSSGAAALRVHGNLAFAQLDVFNGAGSGLAAAGSGPAVGGPPPMAGFQLGITTGSITSAGGPAIEFSGGTGNMSMTAVTATAAPGSGFAVDNSSGTFSFDDVDIAQAAGGSGAGVRIESSAAAQFTFGDLDVVTTGGDGIVLGGVGTVDIDPSGSFAATVDATGGAAVDLNTTPGTMNFSSLTSSDSPGSGLELTNVTGGFQFNGGATTTSNAATFGIHLSNLGTNASVIFGATQVNTRNGTGVFVDNHDGTALQFASLTIPNPNDAAGNGLHIQESASPVSIRGGSISASTVGNAESFTNVAVIRPTLNPDNGDDGDLVFLRDNTGAFLLEDSTLTDSDDDLVDLRNHTGGAEFSNVVFSQSAQHAIQAIGVADLIVRNGSSFSRIADDVDPTGFLGDHAILIQDLGGTLNRFENMTLDMSLNRDGTAQFVTSPFPPGPENKGILLDNEATAGALVIRDVTFRNISNDGIQIIAGGSLDDGSHDFTVLVEGTATGAIKSNLFQALNGRMVSFEHRATTDANTIRATVQHTRYENGGVGLRAAARGGLLDFRFLNNQFSSLTTGTLSDVFRLRAFAGGNLIGRILGNDATRANSGFFTFIGDANDQADVKVDGNTYDGNGITGSFSVATQVNGTADFEITNNDILNVFRQFGSIQTATGGDVCVDMDGNKFTGPAPFFGEGFLLWDRVPGSAAPGPLSIDGWDGAGGNSGAASFLNSQNEARNVADTADVPPFVSSINDIFASLSAGTCTSLP
ncbi:MAG: hypothetical protein AAGF23_09950 [Acidobacteriota bacterium]